MKKLFVSVNLIVLIVFFGTVNIAICQTLENKSDPEKAESTSIDSDPCNSGPKDMAENNEMSCKELYEIIKKSDCGKDVFEFLEGATVKVGLSLSSSNMFINSGDDELAGLKGLLSPEPYYSISLAPSFFGDTNFGYEASITYLSMFTQEQNTNRGESEKSLDLNTYSSSTLAAITPSLFYSIGGKKKNHDVFLRFGLGAGFGWTNVKGIAYYTQDQSSECEDCYNASTEVLNGGDKSLIYSNCDLKSFNISAFGSSVRVFLDGRWASFYSSVELVGLTIFSDKTSYDSGELSLKLAYIVDI